MKSFKQRKVVLPFAIAFILSIGIEITLKSAQAAATPTEAITAVGLSAGAGALLGLSSMAFYKEPGDHFGNVLVGAGVGVIVGVGIAAYMLATDQSDDELDPEELLLKPKKNEIKDGKQGEDPKKKEGARRVRASRLLISDLQRTSVPMTSSRAPSLHKGEWLVAMNVLELRF